MVILVAYNDPDSTSQILGMNIPKATKGAIQDCDVKNGEYAKLVSRETLYAGGK